jgi:hypothetical protein
MIDPGGLTAPVTGASRELLRGAREVLGADLVALYLYGSAIAPDAPARVGDLDAHGIVARRPGDETASRLRALRRSVERSSGLELDLWWIELAGARGAEPPVHLLEPSERDTSWALHRAHLLAGRCVALHGPDPAAILVPPSDREIDEALAHELGYAEEFLPQPTAWRYCVWNACRVVYSSETRDVTASKRTAAAWALEALPEAWHEAIRAAGRAYDGIERAGDGETLGRTVGSFLDYCRSRYERARAGAGA